MSHPSHKTRFSDSSLYDEVCVYCGATDGAGDNRLREGCPQAPAPEPSADYERQAFLTALAGNEDDTTTRLVFADWLDDRGEHDEADRMRKWPEAKAWLTEFAAKCSPKPVWDDIRLVREDPFTYQDVLAFASARVEYGPEPDWGAYFPPGGWGNGGASAAYSDAVAEFWSNWSVVTGRPLPDWLVRHPDSDPFSCSCG